EIWLSFQLTQQERNDGRSQRNDLLVNRVIEDVGQGRGEFRVRSPTLGQLTKPFLQTRQGRGGRKRPGGLRFGMGMAHRWLSSVWFSGAVLSRDNGLFANTHSSTGRPSIKCCRTNSGMRSAVMP